MHSARGIQNALVIAIALIAVGMAAGVQPLSAQEHDAPTAYIDSISPSSATEGAAVVFKGHGTASDGFHNGVTAYEWVSDLDGLLSESRTFVTRDLSPGMHTISFRVQDGYGLWSAKALTTLWVGQSANKSDHQFARYGADEDWDYWTNPPDIFLVPIGNVGIGTTEPTEKLDVRGKILALDGPDLVGVRIRADGQNGVIEGTQKMDSYWAARDLVINPHPFTCVGIGATAPEAKLQIDSGHVGTALNVDDVLYVKGRNVGIGTASPEHALQVNGAINLDPISEPPTPSTGFVLYVDTNDGGLKAKSSQGTITVLATP